MTSEVLIVVCLFTSLGNSQMIIAQLAGAVEYTDCTSAEG